MGTIKNQILGDVSGAVGNVVFKQRGNICYLARKPKSYRTPNDPISIFNRNQFLLISKLAHTINKIDLIKKIWRAEFPGCYSAYHKIINYNFHRLKCNDMSGTPVLTPHQGFRLTNPMAELIGSHFTIKADHISDDSLINYYDGKFIVAASVLFIKCHNLDVPLNICHRMSDKKLLENNSSVQLITDLNYREAIISEDRFLYKSWSVLITSDENDNPVNYSETIPWLPVNLK